MFRIPDNFINQIVISIWIFSSVKLSVSNRLDTWPRCCHSREGGNPVYFGLHGYKKSVWIPAFAGMTVAGSKRLHQSLLGYALRIWSIISSAFGSSDLGALRRYKSLMWLSHTARFAPGIASQLWRPNAKLIADHILTRLRKMSHQKLLICATIFRLRLRSTGSR